MKVKTYSLPGCSLNREHFVRMLLSELIHHFIQLMTELDPKHRERNKWKQIIMRRNLPLAAIDLSVQEIWCYCIGY